MSRSATSRTSVRRFLGITPWLVVAVVVAVTVGAQAQESFRVPDLPATPHNYANPTLPAHFVAPDVVAADNTPAGNPVTDAGATLGRVLFYDVALSANDTTSCASCHVQANSFSDPATLSSGFEGGLTNRHSTNLANAAFYERGRFFWDERAATLEDQVLMPIADLVEMGLPLDEMETKLAAIDYYPSLFEDAFGTPDVTQDRVSLALAQFVRSMISSNSRFDQGVATDFANFTREENQGRRLFQQLRCAVCHETSLQIAPGPRNIGLDADNSLDAGVGDGRFKVASLRNIEVTAPYMHDGRFATLEEVIDHYDSGVQAHPELHNTLDANPDPVIVEPVRLNLTQQEKDALIAFLLTLTDDEFLTDERFSDPFVLASCGTNFADVLAGAFYEDAVVWAACDGITTGTSPDTFSPGIAVTRAQMATFLWRFAGEPAGSPAHDFDDVPAGSFYDEAVAWLKASGITTGTTPTTFGPDERVTRAQMATFLWRFAGEPNAVPHQFTDVPAGSFYDAAVAWMSQTGITTGTSPTTFNPDTTLDRGQTVTFLWRMSNLPS